MQETCWAVSSWLIHLNVWRCTDLQTPNLSLYCLAELVLLSDRSLSFCLFMLYNCPNHASHLRKQSNMPKSLISLLTRECLFLGSNQVRAVSHVTHTPAPFFGSFSDYRRTYAFYKQHCTNRCMLFYRRVVVRSGLWPFPSPQLKPFGFYLWAMLKDKEYSSSHHTDHDLKKSIFTFTRRYSKCRLTMCFSDVRHVC
jgi:hypothetical protein